MSGAPLSLSWFLEVDFDLRNTPGNDLAFGGVNGITQMDGGTIGFVSSTPVPSAFQIAPFPLIFLSLTDEMITTFANTGSPFGPGDAAFGFQWDFELPVNETVTINVNKTIVPEPGTLMLVSAAIGALLGMLARSVGAKGSDR